jgi:hypothetical protein
VNPLFIAGGVAAGLAFVEAERFPLAASRPDLIGVSGDASGAITAAGGESAGTDPDCPVDDNGLPQWWCKTVNVRDTSLANLAAQAAHNIASAASSLVGFLIPDIVWVALVVGGTVYLLHSGVL